MKSTAGKDSTPSVKSKQQMPCYEIYGRKNLKTFFFVFYWLILFARIERFEQNNLELTGQMLEFLMSIKIFLNSFATLNTIVSFFFSFPTAAEPNCDQSDQSSSNQ